MGGEGPSAISCLCQGGYTGVHCERKYNNHSNFVFFYFRKDSDIVHTTVETALKAIRNKMLPFQDRVEPSIRYPESGNLLSGRVRYPVLP